MFAAFLPIIGGILDSVLKPLFDWLNKKEDTKVKIDQDDVATIQARGQVIVATKDDPGIRLARDVAMWGPITYVSIYFWDRMVDIRHPDWVWGVKPLDLNWTDCMPIMAVYAFLFAMAWRGK